MSCPTYAHAVQGVQVPALVLVVAGPGPVSALGAAVSGLGAHNAGHGGQQRSQAVVTVAGVEGGQQHTGERGLLEQDLTLLHSLFGGQISPSCFVIRCFKCGAKVNIVHPCKSFSSVTKSKGM